MKITFVKLDMLMIVRQPLILDHLLELKAMFAKEKCRIYMLSLSGAVELVTDENVTNVMLFTYQKILTSALLAKNIMIVMQVIMHLVKHPSINASPMSRDPQIEIRSV